MKSKEEILAKMFENGKPFYNQDDIKKAMDEYAEQETMEFLRWMDETDDYSDTNKALYKKFKEQR